MCITRSGGQTGELTERQRELHAQLTRVLVHHQYCDSRAHPLEGCWRVKLQLAVDTLYDNVVVRLVATPDLPSHAIYPSIIDLVMHA